MHISHHAQARMSQRGISRRLIEFALRHGRLEGDKHIVDRNEARQLIEILQEELRLAKQIHDKGGISVVEKDDTVITTYNPSIPMSGCRNAAAASRRRSSSAHLQESIA